MKKFLAIASALVVCIFSYAQQMPLIPVDEAVRAGKLDNGLTYYIRHNEEPKGQANFYIAQKVGSILEEENQRGLAHFLEHMCFNGTVNFPGNGIVNYLEGIGVKFGAQLNAYTSIDETVYNIDNVPVGVVPSAVDSCLLILHDWAGDLLLSDEEIDKERGVIHEEWRSRTSAQLRMYEKILPEIYPNNRYGNRMPIGLMEVVDNFPYEALRSYYHMWYRPDLQGIVVVGDIDVDEVEAKIKDIFSSLPAATDAPERVYFPIEDNKEPIISTATDKEQTYASTFIFMKHPAVPDEAKSTLDYMLLQYVDNVVSNMAGNRLAEMTQKADPDFIGADIGDGTYFFSRTCNAFTGVASYDPSQMERAVKSIYREMLRIIRNGFTASEYDRARTEFLADLETAYNQREKKSSQAYCQELVRHFIDNEPIPGIENEFALMSQLAPNIPVELVNQIVSTQYPVDSNLVVVNMLPEIEGLAYPSNEQLKEALASVAAEDIAPYQDEVSDKPLVSKLRKSGKVKKSVPAELGYTKYTLSNGATVYFKHTDFNKDEILVNAFSQGGLSLYSDSEIYTLQTVSDLIEVGGLGDFNPIELNKALTGKKVSATPYVGNYSEGIEGSSTPKDIETLFQLFYLYFTDLRYDEESFASWKTKTSVALANAEAQPFAALGDTIANTIYTNPTWAKSLKYKDLDKVDYARALEIAKERFANASDFTFTVTGNISEDELKPLLCKYIASLPGKGKKESYKQVLDFKPGVLTNEFEKQMANPMALNLYVYNSPVQYDLKDNLTLEIMSSALGIILHEEIRENEGGTYGISAYAVAKPEPVDKAILQITYQTDPQRYEYLNSRVEAIVSEFAENGPREVDVEKTRTNLAKDHKVELEDNSYWSGAISTYIRYGVNMVDGYEEILDSITCEDIKNCLKNILSSGNCSKIVMVGTN